MPRTLTTSPLGRLLRMGTLATRVSTSLAAQQAMSFWLSDPIANARRTESFVLNAMRVTEALGEMKGAAMKVGQMLSVHEGLLPPEVCAVLRTLQRDAPPVSFARMRAVIDAEVPGGMACFRHLDRTPLAAASIGQVYRAQLQDGRDVVVKVQYPDIDRIVAADLKNLKKLFGSLIAMVVDIDFEPLWLELRERLLEELNYRQEAANIARMRSYYADDPTVQIPGVVERASGQRVLVLDYVPGIAPEDACSSSYSQALRNRWGEQLLSFTLRGLLEHQFLHADPNFGNFAFREDGTLVVYDQGCVKDVPEPLARGCRKLLDACLEQRLADLPDLLHALGVYDRSTGQRVPQAVIAPLAEQVLQIVGPEPFQFSRSNDLYSLLLDRNGSYLRELTRLELPPDLMFINRTLSGVYGNLCQLEAQGHWSHVIGSFRSPSPPAANGTMRGPRL